MKGSAMRMPSSSASGKCLMLLRICVILRPPRHKGWRYQTTRGDLQRQWMTQIVSLLITELAVKRFQAQKRFNEFPVGASVAPDACNSFCRTCQWLAVATVRRVRES